MKDKNYAYFFVEGFSCHPNEISLFLDIEPTKYSIRGDYSKIGTIIKENCWCLYSQLSPELFLDEHIEALVTILIRKEKEVLQLVKKYDCGINCVGKFGSPSSSIHISKELLKDLSRLDIPVDFDLYRV